MIAGCQGYEHSHSRESRQVDQEDLGVHRGFEIQYKSVMAKGKALQIRLTEDEKQGFQLAVELAGIALSSWVRERLRLAAIRDLESTGQQIPFVDPIRLEGPRD